MIKDLAATIVRHKYTPYCFGALVILVLCILHVITGSLILTGDEPRYLYSAVSLGTRGDLSLSSAAWANWLVEHHLSPTYEADRGLHSIIHLVMVAPLIAWQGLEAGRWLQLILVGSIATLYWACLTKKFGLKSMIWVVIYFVSIPLFPYLKLIYSEVWLFLLLSVVTLCIAIDNKTLLHKYSVLVCLILLPFIHVRTALAAAVLGGYFVYDIFTSKQTKRRDILIMTILVLLSLLLFITYQIGLTGHLTGTVVGVFEPSLSKLPERIAVQFWGYRHGLFLYTPI